MSAEDRKTTAWLKPNTPAYKALQNVVLDKRLLAALPNLRYFCHTGELEVFHSMLLKYCSKRQHFPFPGRWYNYIYTNHHDFSNGIISQKFLQTQ